MAFQTRKIFQRLKVNEKSITLVKDFRFSKSKITFKISIVTFIDIHSKMKNLSFSFSFIKNYMKMVKEMCKRNPNQFK